MEEEQYQDQALDYEHFRRQKYETQDERICDKCKEEKMRTHEK